jgi:hypothetical protein
MRFDRFVPQLFLVVLFLACLGITAGCETGYDRPAARLQQETPSSAGQLESETVDQGDSDLRWPSFPKGLAPENQDQVVPSAKGPGPGPSSTEPAPEQTGFEARGAPQPDTEISPPSESGPPESEKQVARPYPLPHAPALREEQSPPRGPERPPRSARPPRQSVSFPVQLSAGVALPQTLPTGTAMGFSVDYRWVEGQPDPRVRYFWVIEPAGAPPVRQPVQLEQEGTLQGFALELRPEHGPFQTYLADPRGHPISPKVPLR